MRTFVSDNFAAVDPAVMKYLAGINRGHVPSYSGDAVTEQAEKQFQRVFGEVRFVASWNNTEADVQALLEVMA